MSRFISLTSDFGAHSQGVGMMEGAVLSVCRDANIVHLAHDLPKYGVIAAARAMESVRYFPTGNHVCVCDPGVGTSRRGLICQVKRGDYLIGPDNGVLLPAARMLGGIIDVHEIINSEYMREPVSATFHGRDIFAPVAAHLANGVQISQFGPDVDPVTLIRAPYGEAHRRANSLEGKIIQINGYGSINLNVTHSQWEEFGVREGCEITVQLTEAHLLKIPVARTYGDVPEGRAVIIKDDYGRVEIAKNLGSFANQYPVSIGDDVKITFDP
ncbi:SAM-dependent chlorinase/fluorinase [Streptomyces phaeochromogenes]|nr:SAM-dependent chlorinase/fluorinase [Streptomyces phaeochromogenes]